MKLTNVHGLPASIVEALSRDGYDYNDDPKTISVTSLISPPKIRAMKMRHRDEIIEDASEKIWLLLGNAVHYALSCVSDRNRLIEERLYANVFDWTVTGKPDIYDDATIQDYKVTSAWSMVFEPSGKPEWHQQLNLYAWLLRQNGFDPQSAQIIAILRDWSKSTAQKGGDYPKLPIAVIDVPLWACHGETDQFIARRIDLHALAALTQNDDNIPACSPDERWQKEDVFALMKPGRKSAIKLFDTQQKAYNAHGLTSKSDKCYVENRPGRCVRCLDYCPVRQFCHFGRSLQEEQS